MRARRKDQRKLLKELENNPLVERACKKAGVPRSTFYRWCDKDLSFKTAVVNAQESGRGKMNDFVESKLLESINSGSVPAMRFWLVHNSKLYRTISSGEIKRLRFYEEMVASLLEVAAKQDDVAVLQIIRALRERAQHNIEIADPEI